MSSQIKKHEKEAYKVTMEVDCKCEVGICDHAMEQVTKMLQAAYDTGVIDGVTRANNEFKKMLKSEFPEEFKAAEQLISADQKKLN